MQRRPCLNPRCRRPVASGATCVCGARSTSGTTTQRGYGADWQRTSTAYLAAHPRCEECGSADDLTVDHVVPKSEGGTDAWSNLRTRCRRCHGRRAWTES